MKRPSQMVSLALAALSFAGFLIPSSVHAADHEATETPSPPSKGDGFRVLIKGYLKYDELRKAREALREALPHPNVLTEKKLSRGFAEFSVQAGGLTLEKLQDLVKTLNSAMDQGGDHTLIEVKE